MVGLQCGDVTPRKPKKLLKMRDARMEERDRMAKVMRAKLKSIPRNGTMQKYAEYLIKTKERLGSKDNKGRISFRTIDQAN